MSRHDRDSRNVRKAVLGKSKRRKRRIGTLNVSAYRRIVLYLFVC
jgi:hypothetical protein